MCPACIATAAWIAAGVTSASGETLLAVKTVRAKIGARETTQTKGERNERDTGIDWNAQGRVHSDSGRKAQAVGHPRPPFCGLGDLSFKGFARRSEQAVCVANQRLGWADHPALGGWGQNVGAGRN